jgi:superfamily II DNA or RNA helicase
MKIKVGDIYSTILKPIDYSGLSVIREVCRARPSGFMFMRKYKMGMWDGYISLMGGVYKFPTGLLSRVETALKNRGIEIEYSDIGLQQVVNWHVDENMLEGIVLRDYQVDAAIKLLNAKRGVAKMATNSGKTEIIAAILKSLRKNAIIVVHRKELLYQTAERLAYRTGLDVARIGDGLEEKGDVTVAMVQTLSARNYDYSDTKNDIVIVDECHHVSSDQMMDVLYRIPGEYRYGFSGTPLKDDVLSDLKLISLTGEIVVDISNKYLVDAGYSAKPRVNIITMESVSVDEWEASYQDAYDTLIVNNDARNGAISRIANTSAGTVLILVERIEHGEILNELIPKSVFVNGSFDSAYRQQILKKMKSGGVFIATPIFDEGIDVPSISTLIIACGGNSSNKLLQRLGRGLRKKAYDNVVQVFDFLDDTNIYLFRHSEKRIDTLIEEGFEVVKHEI